MNRPSDQLMTPITDHVPYRLDRVRLEEQSFMLHTVDEIPVMGSAKLKLAHKTKAQQSGVPESRSDTHCLFSKNLLQGHAYTTAGQDALVNINHIFCFASRDHHHESEQDQPVIFNYIFSAQSLSVQHPIAEEDMGTH